MSDLSELQYLRMPVVIFDSLGHIFGSEVIFKPDSFPEPHARRIDHHQAGKYPELFE